MKKLITIITLLIISTLLIYTNIAFAKQNFSINLSEISLGDKSKGTEIQDKFNSKYSIEYAELKDDAEFTEKITKLSEKIIYILLGKPNNEVCTMAERNYRANLLEDVIYKLYLPEDYDILDDKFDEYDDNFSTNFAVELSVYGTYNILAENNVTYNKIEKIIVYGNEGAESVVAQVILSGVKMESANEEEPMKIDIINTSIEYRFLFVKDENNEYKLKYIGGETKDNIDEYISQKEKSEESNGTVTYNSKFVSEDDDLYDMSKLEDLPQEKINEVYEKNKSGVVVLNTYYNSGICDTGTGFFMADGLIATTWNYIKDALSEGQFITARDIDGNMYEIDGFVYINPDIDLVIIKTKEKNGKDLELIEDYTLGENDPVISLGSNGGVKLSVSSGINIGNSKYLNNVLPISKSEAGGPIFNIEGQVIGMNTAKSVDSEISIGLTSKYLIELKNDIMKDEFENITTVSFDELKNTYYSSAVDDERVLNNISEKSWEKCKKIGDLENSIILELVKVNEYKNAISLRYHNKITDIFSNMNMADTFKNNLLNGGYTEVLSSNSKSIYENNDNKILILSEFDYLIIIIIGK